MKKPDYEWVKNYALQAVANDDYTINVIFADGREYQFDMYMCLDIDPEIIRQDGKPVNSSYLDEVRRIVLDGLRNHQVRVYLFGSRARGQSGRSSDIDVAVLSAEPLPPGVLSTIRENLEESNVPYTVDLVDLTRADPAFRDRVIREGTLWSG